MSGYTETCSECTDGLVSFSDCSSRTCDGSHINCRDWEETCVFCSGTGFVAGEWPPPVVCATCKATAQHPRLRCSDHPFPPAADASSSGSSL